MIPSALFSRNQVENMVGGDLGCFAATEPGHHAVIEVQMGLVPDVPD